MSMSIRPTWFFCLEEYVIVEKILADIYSEII